MKTNPNGLKLIKAHERLGRERQTNGVLYETRTDAIPAGITGLRAGVPLMPTWIALIAA